jgi:hypothetical protein
VFRYSATVNTVAKHTRQVLRLSLQLCRALRRRAVGLLRRCLLLQLLLQQGIALLVVRCRRLGCRRGLVRTGTAARLAPV